MFKGFFSETKFSFPNFLAAIVIISCFVYFFWISNTKHETNNNVGEIKTACIALVTMVLQYFFGSSKSSTRKDETISQMASTAGSIQDEKKPEL